MHSTDAKFKKSTYGMILAIASLNVTIQSVLAKDGIKNILSDSFVLKQVLLPVNEHLKTTDLFKGENLIRSHSECCQWL